MRKKKPFGKLKKGAFTKQAKGAHRSVQTHARHVLAHPTRYSTKTRRRANFARMAKRHWKPL
jgi:hypothetical protein